MSVHWGGRGPGHISRRPLPELPEDEPGPGGEILVESLLTGVRDTSGVVAGTKGYTDPAYWGGNSVLSPTTYPPGGDVYMLVWRESDGLLQMSTTGTDNEPGGWTSLTIGERVFAIGDATFWTDNGGSVVYSWSGVSDPFPGIGGNTTVVWRG